MTAPGLAARKAALALVAAVLKDGRRLSEAAAPVTAPLAPAERAMAERLADRMLRHLDGLDWVIGRFARRRPQEPARAALRLAALELIVEGTPAHAAVSAAVALTRAAPGGGALVGLVNAIARRIATEGPALWPRAPAPMLPDWLAAALRGQPGRKVVGSVARACLAVPPVDLTLRAPDSGHRWADRLGAVLLPTGSLRLARPGQISALPGHDDGAWWVQDAAAALPARMLGPVAGARVLDLCAAPGGKTLQLAGAGARVTAVDISAPRLARLAANLRRTGLGAEIVAADILDWAPGEPVGAILLDAPCSASGTVRRHPDLWRRSTPPDLPALTALQDRLLARAWDWLAPGGRLVYAVCSILPAEGPERIAAFRAARPDAVLVPVRAVLPSLPQGWDQGGALVTRPDFWPERGGVDGFFATILQKPAAGA